MWLRGEVALRVSVAEADNKIGEFVLTQEYYFLSELQSFAWKKDVKIMTQVREEASPSSDSIRIKAVQDHRFMI